MHEHAPHSPLDNPFTPAEVQEFHTSDKGAGGAVSVLMTAIFFIGLLMYGVIAGIVIRG